MNIPVWKPSRFVVLVGIVLAILLFVFASVGMYEGALARRINTLESATRLLAERTANLQTSVDATLHMRHAAIVQSEGDTYRIVQAVVATEHGRTAVSTQDPLAVVYPKLSANQIRAVASQGGASMIGRMEGSAGDVVVFATYLPNTAQTLLVAYDAVPLARNVVAAAALPLALATLLYALGALMYFYLRARVQALTQEQEYVALLAHDMRLPIVGLSWAHAFLQSGAKRKGIRREELLASMQQATVMLDDWMRRVIDHTRETRGGRHLPTVRTSLDLRELFDRTRAMFVLYAHARGIVLEYKSMPEHIPVVASREIVERALTQLFSFLIQNDAIVDTLTIAYKAGKHTHEFIFTGIEPFEASPRGLLIAQELFMSQGGNVTVHVEHDAPVVTVRLRRGT